MLESLAGLRGKKKKGNRRENSNKIKKLQKEKQLLETQVDTYV